MGSNGTQRAATSRRFGVRALALTTAMLLLTLSLGAGTTLADGGRDHRIAENTFTKWITAYPAMAGVVGGAVGNGSYSGEILSLDVTATGMVIDATYHFSGSRHTFTALVHVVETGFTDGATAVITGRVTGGWLRGSPVEGAFTQIACSQAPSGSCFRGTLDILRGSQGDD